MLDDETLILLRDRLRYSRHGLGRRLGVGHKQIEKWERREAPIPPYLGWAMAWLLVHGDARPYSDLKPAITDWMERWGLSKKDAGFYIGCAPDAVWYLRTHRKRPLWGLGYAIAWTHLHGFAQPWPCQLRK